jgi:hypothetical protein
VCDVPVLTGAVPGAAGDRRSLKATLVELRYFGGLTVEQAACCLDISLSTAVRAWRYACAWLHAAVAGADPSNNADPA